MLKAKKVSGLTLKIGYESMMVAINRKYLMLADRLIFRPVHLIATKVKRLPQVLWSTNIGTI